MPASSRDCSEESTLPSRALRVKNHTPIARPTTDRATVTATMRATVVRNERMRYSRLLHARDEADTADGVHQTRAVTGLGLAAYVGHVRVEIGIQRRRGEAPHLGHQT